MSCHVFTTKSGSGVICLGGPDLLIEVGGRDYLFEHHRYFGPVPLTKKGAERSLGPRHPFWAAVTAWHAQGCVVVDGRAQWKPAPDPVAEMLAGATHLGGRNWKVVPL